jgi:hypothetical protein
LLRSILHYSGLPISSECIVKGVLAELGEGAASASSEQHEQQGLMS